MATDVMQSMKKAYSPTRARGNPDTGITMSLCTSPIVSIEIYVGLKVIILTIDSV